MSKCFYCGAGLRETSKFCQTCGKSVAIPEALVQQAIAGEAAAQTELYFRTCNAVYARIRAKVSDEDVAQDLLQDTYMRAFQKLDQLQTAAAFPGWVLKIAQNLTIDWYRKNGKLVTQLSQMEYISDEALSAEEDLLQQEETAAEYLPDVSLDRAETSRLLSEILDALPAEQRLVLVMRYYEELSLQEIADALGENLSTVKTRLTAGKKKVEAKVYELERKGTKLYSLAPLPFLLWLLRHYEAAISIPAAQVLQAAGTAGAAAQAATGTAATATTTVSAVSTAGSSAAVGGSIAAAKVSGGLAAKLLSTKVIAGILAASLLVGGAVGATAVAKAQKKATTTVEMEETAEIELEADPTAEEAAQEEVPAIAAAELETLQEAPAEEAEPEEETDFEDLEELVDEAEPEPETEGIVIDLENLVYTAYSYEEDNYIYHVPQIDLDIGDIPAINEELMELCYSSYELASTYGITPNVFDGHTPEYASTTYFWYVNDDILSLVVGVKYHGSGSQYNTVYNVSITTGEQLSSTSILKQLGLSSDAYNQMLQQAFSNAFCNDDASLIYAGYRFLPEIREMYAQTIAQENIDAAVPYLGEDGALCVYYRKYILVGSTWTILNIPEALALSVDVDTSLLFADQVSWQELYMEYISYQEWLYSSKTYYYALIYVDNDAIPELYVYGTSEAEGSWICTIDDDGEITECHLNRLGGAYYLPYRNLFCSYNGNMGYYPLQFYYLSDGEVTELEVGGVMRSDYNEEGDLVETYYWNDEVVSEAQFMENWDSLMPEDQRRKMSGEDLSLASEMLSILKNW